MAYILCKDFTDIDPEIWPTQGASFDVENVLTGYVGNEATASDAIIRKGALDYLQALASDEIRIGLVTHNTSPSFVDAVQGQVEDLVGTRVPTLSKVEESTRKHRDKWQPQVFFDIARLLKLAPVEMTHVDDQWKSHHGAREAGYSFNIWPEPWGESQHSGVKIFRFLVERPFIRAAIANKRDTRIQS